MTMKLKRIFSAAVTFTLVVSMMSGLIEPAQAAAYGNQRVSVSGNEFRVGGKKLWINGANTPWNSWNDFGGYYNATWWDNHFKELSEAGVNATRVWVNCNGDGFINISADGTVTGATAKHWEDLDSLFNLAKKHEIYIMATLISFNHFESPGRNYQYWRNMLSSNTTIDSFVNNYTIPFVTRYKDNPYLWSIDLCNEPDWIFEKASCGNIAWSNISNFFARNAAAIHKNSDVLVTVGMASSKYNADGAGYEGNKISDTYLKSIYNDSKAYVDFYSPHYFDWMGEWYGVPYYVTPSGSRPNGWGLDGSKPAIIGECPAVGSSGKTITQDYQSAYDKGWQGVMAWTSNGVDHCGNLSNLSAATKSIAAKYPNLVKPITKQITKTVTAGADVLITLSGSDIQAFADKYTLTYDTAMLTLIDFAAQTGAGNTQAGVIGQSGLEIISNANGVVTFRINKSIPAGKGWSGVVTVLKFKAISTGTATITVG